MAKLNLTLPDGELPVTGKQVTFFSNQPSGNVTHIIIQGIEFSLVDSIGNHPGGYAFYANTMVSVILNVEQKYAYIQNSAGNSYISGIMAQKANLVHTHEAKDVQGTFGGTVIAKTGSQSAVGLFSCLRNSFFVQKGSIYETAKPYEGEIVWFYE